MKWKVDPRPTSDSSQTRPPCISTIFLTSDRPMPVLSVLSRELSDAAYRLADAIGERYFALASEEHRMQQV